MAREARALARVALSVTERCCAITSRVSIFALFSRPLLDLLNVRKGVGEMKGVMAKTNLFGYRT